MILQHKYNLFHSENISVMCRFHYGVYIRNKGFGDISFPWMQTTHLIP